MDEPIEPTLIGEQKGRSYNGDVDGDDSTRKFKVRSHNKDDYGPDVIPAAGVEYLDIHPKNPFLRALTVSAEQDPTAWWLWIVTWEYGVPDENEEDNPINRPARITLATEEFSTAAVAEVDPETGTPIAALVNSAGEKFDPPPEEEAEILVISIQRYELANVSVALFYGYNGATNSDEFVFGDLTIPPDFAKLRARIGDTEEYVSPVTGISTFYRSVDYAIRLHPFGWKISALDIGTFYFENGKKKSFVTDDNLREPLLGLLDGQGGKLEDDADPVFLKFGNKKRRPFSGLALPQGP